MLLRTYIINGDLPRNQMHIATNMSEQTPGNPQ